MHVDREAIRHMRRPLSLSFAPAMRQGVGTLRGPYIALRGAAQAWLADRLAAGA
jgi:hypothetical protein